MRWMLAALTLFSWQSPSPAPPANLPPAYPRPGTTKLLDNDRVQVWNIAWLKGQPLPLHRHIYDLIGVYYEPGDRVITSVEGAKRPVSTKAWDVTSQRTGVTHIEEGTSDAPLRAVFVEMKLPGSYGTDSGGDAPAFTGDGAVQKLDNERATAWEYVGVPPSRRHRHTHDAVVVSFDGKGPRATWVPRGTTHADEGAPQAARIYIFEIK